MTSPVALEEITRKVPARKGLVKQGAVVLDECREVGFVAGADVRCDQPDPCAGQCACPVISPFHRTLTSAAPGDRVPPCMGVSGWFPPGRLNLRRVLALLLTEAVRSPWRRTPSEVRGGRTGLRVDLAAPRAGFLHSRTE